MPSTTAMKQRNKIINTIVSMVDDKFPKSKANLISEFTRQYINTAATVDLEIYTPEMLFRSVVSLWEFIYQRKQHEIKVRVFNPSLSEDGWESKSTVVEINCMDIPFLVDSTSMEIDTFGNVINLIIHTGGMRFKRNTKNQITDVLPKIRQPSQHPYEAIIHFEISRIHDNEKLQQLEEKLIDVVSDVEICVTDWHLMKQQMHDILEELKEPDSIIANLPKEEVREAYDFLQWLSTDHYIFLGYCEHKLSGKGKEKALRVVRNSGLGLLRHQQHRKTSRFIADMPVEAQKQLLSKQILIIAKTNAISTVHRPVHMDYIGIKIFDKQGKVLGERRFIGLYTSAAYNTNPRHIPLLRGKVSKVMQMSGLMPNGHAAKALLNILETLPRDDLFQAPVNELHELGMGIYHMQEKRQVRLFARKDIYGRYISCLIYLPRDLMHTQLRESMQDILLTAFNSTHVDYSLRFIGTAFVRIHFLIRIDPSVNLVYELKEIEKELIEVARTWQDQLSEALTNYHGEEIGKQLWQRYHRAFHVSYQEHFTPEKAVFDINYLEQLSDDMPIAISIYRLTEESEHTIHVKILHRHEIFSLSDVLPIFENLGLFIIKEHPYVITEKQGSKIWINDFVVVHDKQKPIDITAAKKEFKLAFSKIWHGEAENDQFNRLVLEASLTWREVMLLRAYAKYQQQIGFTFSQSYIEHALANNSEITQKIIELFHLTFSPEIERSSIKIKNLTDKVEELLENVSSLDEDRILRRYLAMIQATLRTNYYQANEKGCEKSYLSLKLAPSKIPDMPLPLPMYEIFVYSPRFEGVHLRSGKVARGGLRWSDRREDFRTEILGLMKAQAVKNSVIVPAGAKGGFVPKQLPKNGSRDEVIEEVISCYKSFISGLLDITDNQIDGQIITPENVVCYDDSDPYLVVAADKGTATFSDIANEVAAKKNFWLGDAFASGGSAGYDHKKMGITARGAWESVKRHFRELGVDVQKQEFTVIGIGDMAGDVFGNGMLLSKHIQLVAAFNHQHIFLDPNPDTATSYQERKRLFNLTRSSWQDYNPKLISRGGGIFNRSDKYIKVTPEMKKLFSIKAERITSNDLIQAILKLPVDLLWNGGIGTFVKAKEETHEQVGDRSNDAIRVNAEELQCKVIGEGGNLGITQLARVEYSLQGGRVYTDFIDNSAGVDCSDHEVNVKILLNDVVNHSKFSYQARNKLLAEMTDEVASLVLKNNYYQTQAISRIVYQAKTNIDLYANYLRELEESGYINRELEFLPDEKTITERKNNGQVFTRPEIAVLLAYSKNLLKEQILQTDIVDDVEFADMLAKAFPQPIVAKYHKFMLRHSLRREIIATQVSNTILNTVNFTFVKRLADETGACIGDIVRAYTVAARVFRLNEVSSIIANLDTVISAQHQAALYLNTNRLMRRAARWFLKNRRNNLNVANLVNVFSGAVQELEKLLPNILGKSSKQKLNEKIADLCKLNIPEETASMLATQKYLFSALDIIDGSTQIDINLKKFATIYHQLSEFMQLDWVRDQITHLTVVNNWQSLARANYRDDIDYLQNTLALGVVKSLSKKLPTQKYIQRWYENNQGRISRWQTMLTQMRNQGVDYTMLYVLSRELFDIAMTSLR
jgi:glutamate dehydrogenase